MDYTKLTLRICGWSSIAMGMVFFVYPEWYADLEANTENSMVEGLGAALVAVNGFGALIAARDPSNERNLYDVVMLASVLETTALAWSVLEWEFSATERIFVTGPLIVAAMVSFALIFYRPKPTEENLPEGQEVPDLSKSLFYSMEMIAAMLDIIHEDATSSCNQSPLVVMPYEKTLSIKTCSQVPDRTNPHSSFFNSGGRRLRWDLNIFRFNIFVPANMSSTPARSRISHRDTSPIPCTPQ